jgi:hypothetical protein
VGNRYRTHSTDGRWGSGHCGSKVSPGVGGTLFIASIFQPGFGAELPKDGVGEELSRDGSSPSYLSGSGRGICIHVSGQDHHARNPDSDYVTVLSGRIDLILDSAEPSHWDPPTPSCKMARSTAGATVPPDLRSWR